MTEKIRFLELPSPLRNWFIVCLLSNVAVAFKFARITSTHWAVIVNSLEWMRTVTLETVILSCNLGAVGLFRSDMLLIFNMIRPWFFCGTVFFVCPQSPYRDNDMIFCIFPVVLCHAFRKWHWPICKKLDLRFIWGHHHLHLVDMDDQSINGLLHYWLHRADETQQGRNSCPRLQFWSFSLDSIMSLSH